MNSGTDPDRFVQHTDPKKKGELIKLYNEHKENAINNNSYPKKALGHLYTKYSSPQKQSSERR
ncbi:hypothetical protein [Wolbachia pipientis]|uniref:hypothetical protein n=1 Tax=Wolbachia pipientis TaxID=955 RepID=UPI0025A3A86A|nr:hypothetical protein [Wolbachia pipientis]MDM8335367.1 hypothetical protein [Wolbachia pipientis]